MCAQHRPPQPAPPPMDTIAGRLEDVRGGLSLKNFWKRLREGWDEEEASSYEAARTYHISGREPPRSYLARVVEVFPEVNPEWLLTGRGPKTRAAVEAQREADQRARAGGLWAVTEAAMVKDFPRLADASVTVRMALLELAGQWVSAAASGRRRSATPEEEKAVGKQFARALAAPLDVLGMSAENMSVLQLNIYLRAMAQALAVGGLDWRLGIASEAAAQQRRWRRRSPDGPPAFMPIIPPESDDDSARKEG